MAATTLGAPAPSPARQAHDGVDHGSEPGAASALDWANYEKITLTKDVGEPIDLAVLPDKRVLHTARNGDVRLTDPAPASPRSSTPSTSTRTPRTACRRSPSTRTSRTNKWVYLYYAPRDA